MSFSDFTKKAESIAANANSKPAAGRTNQPSKAAASPMKKSGK